MTNDLLFMQRALELAELGRGKVSPNPLVGCVIVWQDKIIGEGWHQKYGEAHAEVNALNSVKDKSLLHESTLYVNLEPCSHFGKTPPCADLLVQYPIQKVVICNPDPNPLVAGKGIEKLKAAGISVEKGILEENGRELNKRFFYFFEKKKPYIILKWAETADGFIARKNYDSKWISNELSRLLVHKWRSEEAAVLVGTNTARYDNPQLTVRDWSGKNPLRIVIDRYLKLPSDVYLFDKSTPTLCYNLLKDEKDENLQFRRLGQDNFLESIVADLYQQKRQSLLVEGGAFLLNQFLEKGFWNEARVFKSDTVFVEGIEAPPHKGRLIHCEKILNDWYFEYRNEKA